MSRAHGPRWLGHCRGGSAGRRSSQPVILGAEQRRSRTVQIYESPEEGNHRYQRQLATALADGLGLDDGLKAAQSNGWEGVLDVLLGKRPVECTRPRDFGHRDPSLPLADHGPSHRGRWTDAFPSRNREQQRIGLVSEAPR